MREEYVLNGIKYIRVPKQTARKLFDEGECVGICPVNIRPDNRELMCDINPEKFPNWSFEDHVNQFVDFACLDDETGKTPKFFRKEKFYVTMTDSFMSGWGCAEGLINKFVVACDTPEQAYDIASKAERRDEMKYVRVTRKKPYYRPSKYLVSWEKYKDIKWK